jgi:DNA-binding LytR/AlgR family response regulator
MPAMFQVVVRVLRLDTPIVARWNGSGPIVITAPAYRGNFLLSPDLRAFDTLLRPGEQLDMQTPLDDLRSDAADGTARLTLTLRQDVQRQPIHFFCYTGGRIEPLRVPD